MLAIVLLLGKNFFFRKCTVDKEYIEFYECEQVMSEELCDEYVKVERIVAHQVISPFSSGCFRRANYFVS